MSGAFALVFFLLVLTSPAQALRFCVSRVEDEGSVNIYPVALMVDGHAVATLLGGDTKCARSKGPASIVGMQWHAFDWNKPDHGLQSGRLTHSPTTIVMHLKGRPSAILKVCSRGAHGEPPIWHINGDGWGNCP